MRKEGFGSKADVIVSRAFRYSSWISLWCYYFVAERIEGLNNCDLGENLSTQREKSWKNTFVLHGGCHEFKLALCLQSTFLAFHPFTDWIATNRELWVLKKDPIILAIQMIVGELNSKQNCLKTKFIIFFRWICKALLNCCWVISLHVVKSPDGVFGFKNIATTDYKHNIGSY